MSYLESAEGLDISKARALKELLKHGVDSPEEISDFLKDLGDHKYYKAVDVLRWLGF
jgi:hypothetical protein